MKKKIVIANWKMNLNLKETKDLTKKIIQDLKKIKKLKNLEIVLCPSFPAIFAVKNLISQARKLPVYLGAQNVFWEEKGAYTGEVSVPILKELGVKFIILGHSERREYLKEDNEMIHKKTRIVLAHHLIPILCVGETFEERLAGQKDVIIIKQVSRALEGIALDKKDKLIIAYEPVWVIGSGQAVKPDDAKEANLIIKQRLFDLFPVDFVENNIRLIYGGSVDKTIIKDFIEKDIDGFLIGGSSLEPEEFIEIIKILSVS